MSMKQLAGILLLLLAFMPASFAQPSPFQRYGYYAAPDGASFTAANFSFHGSLAYAIVSGGEVYAILVPGQDSQPREVLEPGELQSALYSYYVSAGYSPRPVSELGPVHEGIRNAASAYQQGEDKCRILTGADRFPCDGFDSCMRACYSVTSFCQPIALAVGRPFINAIWEFENSSKKLGEAYALEDRAFAALSSNASDYNVRFYLYSIDEVEWVAKNTAASPLFYDYSYCFQPNYSLSGIAGLRSTAQAYYASSGPFFTLGRTAALVQNRTLAAMEKKARFTIQPSVPALAQPKAPSAPAAPVQPGGIPSLGSLGVPVVALAALAVCAYVLARRKKRGLEAI